MSSSVKARGRVCFKLEEQDKPENGSKLSTAMCVIDVDAAEVCGRGNLLPNPRKCRTAMYNLAVTTYNRRLEEQFYHDVNFLGNDNLGPHVENTKHIVRSRTWRKRMELGR